VNALAPINATLSERMAALRRRAGFFASQRRKDVALYGLLADCLALCEEVERDGLLPNLMAQHIGKAESRRYFERGADVYLVVGRLVFEDGEKTRAAAWRYTAAMREAAKRQIAPADLAEWLRTEGGINELFRRRPKQPRKRTIRTLSLNSPVPYEDGRELRLVLRADGRGFFDVISSEVQP
jgi:hypothetical protein